MSFMSVTRMKVRAPRYLPAFGVATLRVVHQARRSPGFVGGQLVTEPSGAFWTVTVWADRASMRRYHDSGAHRRTMPKLKAWAGEASAVHWEQEDAGLPDIAEVRDRMAREGRPSPLSFPSRAHAAREVAPGERKPRRGPRIPVARRRSREPNVHAPSAKAR